MSLELTPKQLERLLESAVLEPSVLTIEAITAHNLEAGKEYSLCPKSFRVSKLADTDEHVLHIVCSVGLLNFRLLAYNVDLKQVVNLILPKEIKGTLRQVYNKPLYYFDCAYMEQF